MPFGPTKRLFSTLRFRLTAWNTVTIIFVLGTVLIGVRQGLNYTLMRELDQLLQEDAVEVVLEMQRNYPNWERIDGFLDRKSVSHREHGWFGLVNGSDGATKVASPNRPEGSLPNPPESKRLITATGNRLAHRKVDMPDHTGWDIWVGANLEFIADDIDRLTNMMLAAGAAVLLIAPLSGYWLAGRATHPLAEIIRTTARLHPDRLEERLRLRGTGDELDQLSGTINHSLDLIAAHIKSQREFVANAAHELRSPLAAIRASVEVALDQDRSTEEYRELLADVAEESDRLSKLTNRLLLLAEGDAGFLKAGDRFASIDRCAEQAVDMFRGVAEQHGVRLNVQVNSGALVRGETTHLRRVVQNLVDNAIKFSPAGGEVVISSFREQDMAIVQVRDSGIGIPLEDLPHVFNRFFRSDRSRQAHEISGGTGLGLSICQSIVQAYQGRIEVTSQLGEGTTVTVRFPIHSKSEISDNKVS